MWIAGCGRIVIGDDGAGNFVFANGDENALRMECRGGSARESQTLRFFASQYKREVGNFRVFLL